MFLHPLSHNLPCQALGSHLAGKQRMALKRTYLLAMRIKEGRVAFNYVIFFKHELLGTPIKTWTQTHPEMIVHHLQLAFRLVDVISYCYS